MSERKTNRSRRGRGEGSIFQRGDGRWVASVVIGRDANGKMRRKVVYGTTKKEAADKLAKLQSRRVAGDLDDVTKLTVAKYLDAWLRDAARPTLRDSSFDSYEELIRVHIKPRVGGVALAKLTPLHVRGILTEMGEAGLSPRRQQYVRCVLRRALAQAVKWEMLTRNVCDAVESPRIPKHEIKPFDDVQAVQFLRATDGEPLHALFVLAVGAGMRQGELLGLQWDDLDLKTGTLSVRRSVRQKNGTCTVDEPKTAKGRRLVELPGVAVEALQAHRVAALAAGRIGHRWVFCDDQGEIVGRHHIRRVFERILKAAGLPVIRFHDLRHTSASLMLATGAHPKVVQERLGHSTIAITMDTYSHVMPGLQRESADKLDGVLTGKCYTRATFSGSAASGG